MPGMLESTEYALAHRLADEQASNRVPSVVAAVIRGGEIVWSGSRGWVDSAGGTRPDDDTQYRVGSITKSLVATQVMRLRDEGKVDLAEPIETYLPGTAFGRTTIAQLLSHGGGLTSESPGSWWERSEGGGWSELEVRLGPGEVKHTPGTRLHYSNVGYGVLGELIGRIRGTSWLDAVRAELLDPLGMSRTTDHPRGKHAPGYAVHPFADMLLREPTPDAGAMAPAGQLWSTVNDLARWTAFLGGHSEPVLSPDTVAEMRIPATVDEGDVWAMGFGLGIQLFRQGGKRLAGHTGSMPGFLASAMIDPATGTGALAMANTTSGAAIPGLVVELISILDEREPAMPAEWQPAPTDPDLLALTGLWHWGPTPFHLRIRGSDTLYLGRAESAGRASRFRPLGRDTWVGLDGYYAGETLRVCRGADGSPSHLNLATFVFTRTPYDPEGPVPGGVDEQGWH